MIGHIDQFYFLAREFAKVSQQVIDQKRVVTDIVYAQFYGSEKAVTNWDYVRFLLSLPEYRVFYYRMQLGRIPLMEGEHYMLAELEACKEILHIGK